MNGSFPAAGNHVFLGDNLDLLARVPDGSVNLVYIDPPFNTGHAQERVNTHAVRDDTSARVGFRGKAYRSLRVGQKAYDDAFDDYLGFLEPRLLEARRVLAADGAFFLHLDYREVHYGKVLVDGIFGRGSFINEIIWAYDYGARSRSRWPTKHSTILFYARDPRAYTFDLDASDRIAYMAPEMVGEDKAARGKTPTDVWWHTIVSPTGHEKTGYPSQKPLGIMRRLLAVHSRPGDTVLDFFAGSGSTGVAAAELGRRFILCDSNPEAIAVMKTRLDAATAQFHDCDHVQPAPKPARGAQRAVAPVAGVDGGDVA
jgi:site-specific DNA-methyltransferase (adenine-specific)